MDNALPATIGNYQVIAKLGEGGMASVYLGMAFGKARFRKLVVTKVLHPTLCNSTDFLESFLAEARLAAQLNHPNVVNTYEVGEDQGRPFIAMEYLEGQSYWSLLKKVGRANLPLEVSLEILIDMLTGLQYAHDFVDLNGTPLDMVHRDISPQNVFVTYDGQVKLLDFGLAKASCIEQHTKVGTLKGKIAYLAPEQANGGPVDRRTDIFAVGVMLWEALAGRRFSTGTLDVATIHKRIAGAEPRIRAVCPEAPPALAEACDRALAVKPEDRFATAEEMRAVLLGVVEQRWQRNRIRSLSTIMTEAFSDERTSIRSIVERYSRAAEEKSDSQELQLATPVSGLDDGEDVRIDVEDVVDVEDVKVPPPLPASARPVQWKRAALAGGLLLAVVAAGSAWFMMRPGETATAPVARPQEVEAERRPEPIELVVVTSPPEARASIDGVVVQGNPVRVKVDRDERLHTIRVEAPGFEPFERTVAFDESLVIKASLRRLVERTVPPAPVPAAVRAPAATLRKPKPAVSSRPAAPPPQPRPAESTSPGDDLRQGTTTAPDRAIDEKDPYQP
jgi:serine/threonine-protein kinase